MPWHYLRGNKGCYQPQSMIFFDTETESHEHPTAPGKRIEQFRLGCATRLRREKGRITRRKSIVFWDTDDFWRFVIGFTRPREVVWVFAHGIGFDLRVVGWRGKIDSGELKLVRRSRSIRQPVGGNVNIKHRTALIVLDDPPTIVDSYTLDSCTIRFVDTRNYWRCSLADIGEQIGVPKLEMPEPWSDQSAWLEYCKRDCDIVEHAVLKLCNWHQQHDMGVWKPTAAGMSMQVYRHRLCKHKIVIHDQDEIKSLERDAYFGGQVETYYFGHIDKPEHERSGFLFDKFDIDCPRPTGPIHQLDVNSLYPSVMRDNLFPIRLGAWHTDEKGTAGDPVILGPNCIGDVWIESPCGAFPVRMRGGVKYASGSFRACLAGPELARAVRLGYVKRVYRWAWYELAPIFTHFVDYFWALRWQCRTERDAVGEGLCKLILNSLYGKFAQKSASWVNRPETSVPEPWSNWSKIDATEKTIRKFRSLGTLCQEQVQSGNAADSFIAISAFVTSYARERMRVLREIAGQHNVYYQAVDSLYVSDLGLQRLKEAGQIDNRELGSLRHDATGETADFLGGGYYRVGSRWVRSSVFGGSVRIDWEKWQCDRMQGLEAGLTCGPELGVEVSVEKVSRSASKPSHGVTENGWVLPCILNGSQREVETDIRDCTCLAHRQ